MSLVARLRSRLTYANVMSTIAVFVALGGGAYALSVPKNSIGSRQLKRNAVTSPKIRNRSLKREDLAPGVIPRPTVLGGARATDTDPAPTPGALIKSTSLSLNTAGKAFVLATLNNVFLTCGTDPCRAVWGIYVDNQPVSATGVRLQAGPNPGSDGYTFYTLYGVTPTFQPGSHTVTLNMTSAGNPDSAGQLSAQLGAIASGA
jgi:hypothetical protein